MHLAAMTMSKRPLTYEALMPIPRKLESSLVFSQVEEFLEDFKAGIFKLEHEQPCKEELFSRVDALISNSNAAINSLEYESGLSGTDLDFIMGYVFKELSPFILKARLPRRTYFKPRGYAGDFKMMELLYQNKPNGEGLLGPAIDAACLSHPAAEAVRNRRETLRDLLVAEYKDKKQLSILNLACGSSREFIDFIYETSGKNVSYLGIDSDKGALDFTKRLLRDLSLLYQVQAETLEDNVVKWATSRSSEPYGLFDVVYSSGLTDYLRDGLFVQLVNKAYDCLKPGGKIIIGNFSNKNPNKAWMDRMLLWRLIHRSPEDLERLFARSKFKKTDKIISEKCKVNLFVISKKEEST